MTSANLEEIQKQLVTVFPDSQIEFVSEGWVSKAFRVGDTIVRVPNEEVTLELYERSAALCKFIAPRIGVPVPDLSINYQYIPCSIHREIQGKTWDEIKLVKTLSFAEQDLLATDCALFLHQLHSIDCIEAKIVVPNLDFETTGGLDLEQCASAFHGFLPQRQIEKLLSKYESASARETERIVLSHRDFHGDNSVIDNNNRLCGVFDWDNCGFGSREHDLQMAANPDTPMFSNTMLIEYNRLSGQNIVREQIVEQRMMSLVATAFWAAEKSAEFHENEMNNWVVPQIKKYL